MMGEPSYDTTVLDMNSQKNNEGEEVKAPDTPSHTSLGAERRKDVLQLLKEQSVKMEKLARALSVIQQCILRSNPGHIKDSVGEAAEVLIGMLNTHKCLLEIGVEIPQRLESHPATKRMGIFSRSRSAFLDDTPKKLTKGKKRVASFPPRSESQRKGRAAHRPPTPRSPEARPHKRMGNGSWWKKRKKKVK